MNDCLKVKGYSKYQSSSCDSPRTITQIHRVNNTRVKLFNGKNPTDHTRNMNRKLNAVGHLFRTILLDVPLMVLFGLFVGTTLLHAMALEYYIPQIKLMQWNKKRQVKELTYYNRVCTGEDITTNNTTDLMINEDMNANDCMEHILKHGVSLYSGLISNETAKAARDYVLERNQIEKGWFVIENEKRYSFGVDVNSHPSIQQALKEISQNKNLQAALNKIVGPNPAVVEFTSITSLYGAADQFMHQDVLPKGSAFKYARSFAPTYSLFIPLQDTTAEMGSTSVCPGTHQCSSTDIDSICERDGAILVAGEDSWKSGTGALLNQQTFHRGTAHIDEQGPDRVLFILTLVSRPRFGRNQVETRMIGQGGSYSLKWDQWGHTMKDFANSARYMSQPWKTLRSLGVYSPPGRDLGWDYITVSSMRIANEDVGYGRYNLEEFVEEGGFTFLPDFLMPELEEDDNWVTYLKATIAIVEEWLEEKVIQVHVGYLAAMVLGNIILLFSGYGEKGNVFARSLGRLILTHGLVIFLALTIWYRVGASQWAENIDTGMAFHSLRSYTKTKQPATLPCEMDVLQASRYRSSFLASYKHILEVNHPGNHQWTNTIRSNSLNYHNLPLPAKLEVTKMVVSETKLNHMGRFLKQTEDSRWVVMSDEESWLQAHIDLSKTSDKVQHFVITLLEYFQAGLTVGIFRETALHRLHISDLLEKLQDRMIGALPIEPKSNSSLHFQSSLPLTVPPRSLSPSKFTSLPSSKISDRDAGFVLTTIPEREEPVAPYPAAWIQEGDVVEGQYRGKFNEWYRAKVAKINANRGKIDITYGDGDKDKGLCRLCVRPYESFKINESVQLSLKGEYYEGRIVRIRNNDKYNVQTDLKGLRKNVKGHLIRRFVNTLEEGSIIEALFQGASSEEWFRGRIWKVNADGTYDIKFDDGDKEYSVDPERVRLVRRSVNTLEAGSIIEGLFQGASSEEWFRGRILKVNAGGTYDIVYDDGDREYSVDSARVRLV